MSFDAELGEPTDAVGGTPADYVPKALRHTLSMLATLTSVDDLLAHWTC